MHLPSEMILCLETIDDVGQLFHSFMLIQHLYVLNNLKDLFVSYRPKYKGR